MTTAFTQVVPLNTMGMVMTGKTYTGSYAPYPDADEQKIAFQEISVTVSANGGASRIAAGKDLNIRAMQLDNNASTILAANNIALSGNELNNKSWTDGSITAYQVYRYGVGFNAPRPEAKPRSYTSINSKGIGYTLDGAPVYEANGSGSVLPRRYPGRRQRLG